MASYIENYGLIGDTEGSALVSRDGAIDWLCLPRFDADACCAGLLGRDEHGTWVIHPAATVRKASRRYRPDTMVLETEFACDSGVARIVDFMPVTGGPSHSVVRIVEGLEGKVPIDMVLAIRFEYGRTLPWIRRTESGIELIASPDALILRTPAELDVGETRVNAQFEVSQGEKVPFQLTWHPCHLPPPAALDVGQALTATERFWMDWAARCKYVGPHRDAVLRSLITLKALTYGPTGGIVAAPTTSLPEELGGVRNWDYRYCWLRDSALTLDALMLAGYPDEAMAFRRWLLRVSAGDPARLQIMYGIDGTRRLTEIELDWLPGYAESRPVHIGNGAWDQFQIDVYGEIMDTMYKARRLGAPEDPEAWPPLLKMLGFLETAWQRPDEGIWEVRGAGNRHFTHSKLMAWVAFDRAVKLITEFGFGAERGLAMLPHWRALRDRIHRDICENGYDASQNAFTQSYGSRALDASVLLMTTYRFLPIDDPRIQGTIRAIERGLMREGFVRRYATELSLDGLPGDEAPFLACSFWLADAYAASGRVRDAELLFERLLSIRNDLGLLAEEYEPKRGRHLGNFPQGFSHLALIHTATVLASPELHRVAAGNGARAAMQADPFAQGLSDTAAGADQT
jgi:GH15 family glucan-1,4-alpha-glucosidase